VTTKELLHIINKANELDDHEYKSLVELYREFPYFVLPSILAAKYQRIEFKADEQNYLAIAATQSPDRRRLKFLIENQLPFIPFLSENEPHDEDSNVNGNDVNETEIVTVPEDIILSEKNDNSLHEKSSPEDQEARNNKDEKPEYAPELGISSKNKRRGDILKDL
jgi:hypothetical protein